MSAEAAHGSGRHNAASARAAAARLDAAEFAEYLRAERERRRLTLDQVADATKIATHHLAALERGDVRHWPGGMYRRAMMRAYAESIGVDREFALRQFERAFDSPSARPESARPESAFPEPARRARKAAAAEPSRPAVRRPLPRGLVVALAAVFGVGIGAGLWRLASGDDVEAGDRTTAPVASVPAGIAATVPGATAPTTGTAAAQPVSTTTKASAGEAPSVAAPPRADAGRRTEAAAPAPVRARPAASEGSLVVTSEPAGARVTVNGIGWGETPVTIRHLPLGEKRVRLTRQGYVSQERVVRLAPDDADARLRITLRERP